MSDLARAPIAQNAHQIQSPAASGLLQRQCACGNHTVAGGECAECGKQKSGLQRKLAIGASNDPLEQEADRVADQVLATPAYPAVSGAPARIQRYAGQAIGQTDTAPLSVDRVLASPGRPLDPALQQDMGQRFGHDFSRVRMHSGGAAEQSAREVNAHAYTAGHNIVFGAGQFAPGTHAGRRLIAHELTHVVQQTGAPSPQLVGLVSPSRAPAAQIAREAVNADKLINNPTRVDRLIIDGVAKTVTMLTNQGAFRYDLDVCDVTEGDYIAGVTYNEKKSTVDFNVKEFEHQPQEGDNGAEREIKFKFHWVLKPSAADPSSFFKGQTEVPVTVRTSKATDPSYPGIAPLPAGSYVDNVKMIEYSVDDKPELTGLSTLLKATYDDGTVLNMNLYNLEDSKMNALEVRHAIAHGYVGAGGRVFPLRMNRNTTPQLWRAREEAIEMMEESNSANTTLSFNIVTLVMSFPAIVAGMPPGSPIITRRTTPRSNAQPRQAPVPEPPVTPPSNRLTEGKTPPAPKTSSKEAAPAKPTTPAAAPGEQLNLFPELSESAPSRPLAPQPSVSPAPSGSVPRIDVGEIKSVKSEKAGWRQINGRKFTHKIPDSGHEAVITYDAEGNIRAKVRTSGGDEKVIFDEVVGQVPKEQMPNAKYGTKEFGDAIEDPIRIILEKVTGQKFFIKNPSATGADIVPPQPALPMEH